MTETTKRQNPKEIMNKIIDVYSSGITKIKNYREYAKPKTIKLDDSYDERTLQEIEETKQNAKVSDMIDEIKKEVQNLIDEYSKSENEYFQLDGQAITADYEFVKADILNAEQVRAMQNKYKDNMTMLALINNYAKNKNYQQVTPQSKEERIDIIETFNKMIYPRFTEQTASIPSRYDFTEQAEKYNEMYQSRFNEV